MTMLCSRKHRKSIFRMGIYSVIQMIAFILALMSPVSLYLKIRKVEICFLSGDEIPFISKTLFVLTFIANTIGLIANASEQKFGKSLSRILHSHKSKLCCVYHNNKSEIAFIMDYRNIWEQYVLEHLGPFNSGILILSGYETSDDLVKASKKCM